MGPVQKLFPYALKQNPAWIFILTFHNHHVIAIKCMTTTDLFISRGWCSEAEWNHPLKWYFVTCPIVYKVLKYFFLEQRIKTVSTLSPIQWKFLFNHDKRKDSITKVLLFIFDSIFVILLLPNKLSSQRQPGTGWGKVKI